MTEAIRGQWRDVMKAWTQAIKTSRDWQFSLQVLRSLNKKRIQKDTWDVRCYSYHWRLGRFDVSVQQHGVGFAIAPVFSLHKRLVLHILMCVCIVVFSVRSMVFARLDVCSSYCWIHIYSASTESCFLSIRYFNCWMSDFLQYSKVVSTHLWNTPLNLYQQAIKGFLS